jgi:HEAT repeat protein
VADNWLSQLYSRNPEEIAQATRHLEQLGGRAVPEIRGALQNPKTDRDRRKGALKACAILGPAAEAAIPDVAATLAEPDLTPEAALALSFMGGGALAPLRDALSSGDPVVRREALRSIGKLKDRAPLDAGAVLPLLFRAIVDPDAGVRAVAATYLGIVREGGPKAVAALVEGLADPEADVRRTSAAALGSFGADAESALPALRKAAAADVDPDVAREAGVALVKLQPSR